MTTHLNYDQSSDGSRPNDFADKGIRKADLPPSPSTNGSIRQQQAQRECGRSVENLSKSLSQVFEDLPEGWNSRPTSQKRKRICDGHRVRKRCKKEELSLSTVTRTGSQSAVQEQDNHLSSIPDSNNPEAVEDDGTTTDPVQYWAHNQRWPENFADMNEEQSASSKRRASDSSYTQRHKDGEVPEAYSAAYEKFLAEQGMVMDEVSGHTHVLEESKSLCGRLLRGVYPEPQYTKFPIAQFLSMWQRAQTRNEARVFRDLTSLLVPSPELLFVSGHDELQHFVEEIGVEWTKCETLAGPRPRPDFAVGIASSAFSKEELAKLENYSSPQRPAAFTENLYFPFVLCEAKCGEQGIRRADRQNMHSSSIAVNAIVMLEQTLGPDYMTASEGKILVYSISHDNERVKLYGHFMYQGIFYRYPIASFVLNFEESHGWKRTHDFFREIYRLVYPNHLKRIQDALAVMPDPRKVSMASSMSYEDAEGDEPEQLDQSLHLSEENTRFKRPGEPASKKQKSDMALLQAQFAEQQKRSEEQQKQSEEQLKILERKIAEQADQYNEQTKLLKQLLERQ